MKKKKDLVIATGLLLFLMSCISDYTGRDTPDKLFLQLSCKPTKNLKT